jgi:hypothetical protein
MLYMLVPFSASYYPVDDAMKGYGPTEVLLRLAKRVLRRGRCAVPPAFARRAERGCACGPRAALLRSPTTTRTSRNRALTTSRSSSRTRL